MCAIAGVGGARLLVSLPSGGGAVSRLRVLCVDAARALSAAGVSGVSVLAADGVHGMAAVSDADTERIEELRFVAGEGPFVAYASAARR